MTTRHPKHRLGWHGLAKDNRKPQRPERDRALRISRIRAAVERVQPKARPALFGELGEVTERDERRVHKLDEQEIREFFGEQEQ